MFLDRMSAEENVRKNTSLFFINIQQSPFFSQQELNELLSKAIFVSGAPLSLFEHPLWEEFFAKLRPSFELPSRKQISTALLDFHYEKTKKMVDDEVKNSNVLHLQLDGWSNIRNESIINFVVTQPKPLFVDFVATEEKRHTGEYMATKIAEVMERYGSDKFYSCIGDNAANMQLGLRKTVEKFPHINAFGCKAHVLNLLCSDILNKATSKKVFANAKKVIKKINKSHCLNSVFKKKQTEKGIQTTLKIPPNTRWGYANQCLNSLIQNKAVLRLMAADPDMNKDFDVVNITGEDSEDGDNEEDEEEVEPELPGEVKKMILNDQFWSKIECLHEILQPIAACIAKIETDDAIIHKAYDMLNKLFLTVESLVKSSLVFDARDKKNVEKCVQERKATLMHPILLAAAILDPAAIGSQLTPEETMDGTGFIFESAKKVELNEEEIMTQFTNYKAKQGMWAKQFLWVSCSNVKPIDWWKTFFGHTALAKMAEKILTAPMTSAATERSFSTFGNIHTKKRNRLTTERSGKITFVAHNHKLMQKQSKQEEPTKKRKRYAETDSDDENE